ncbi:hypothetical protein CQ022_13090 [Chryseobacterium culicis]|uniref:Uncharacterized protein n=2 Tax=Chryseobacterium culicis TaxID=680127 RepID=A0A2S9CRE3_CHRCI|nr:hypothetical protein [Chryseobacterium culicis]PRB83066.1 hypothetical protein CQ022_13090 [Chryseobacterium culicis]PRB89307.1 hypothetical protein CQ033_11990 [Chryseobacterium culicis]
MIEMILMLFGLAFSNNNANTTTINDNNPTTVTTQGLGMGEDPDTGGSDTGGDTIQVPPKK